MQLKADAIGDFDRRWRRALMAYFVRRVRDRQEAEDLTQEVFTRLVAKSGTTVVADGYIFTIAAHLLADRARRAKVRVSHQNALERLYSDDENGIDPYRVVASRAELAAIENALSALPERQRSIFILYRFENICQESIAETYGISVSAVKKQVAKTMALLVAQRETER